MDNNVISPESSDPPAGVTRALYTRICSQIPRMQSDDTEIWRKVNIVAFSFRG